MHIARILHYNATFEAKTFEILHSEEEIQNLANFAIMTNFTVNGKDRKYIYVKSENGVLVRTYLPPSSCKQYLVTNLALIMKKSGKLNFAAIMRFEHQKFFFIYLRIQKHENSTFGGN